MPDYKKPYFQLFCIICDTIEELEQLWQMTPFRHRPPCF